MLIKLWIVRVWSSGVTSLKTVIHQSMMMRGAEDLELWQTKLRKKLKMPSVTITDWLWKNYLQCFHKSPHLCYMKPTQQPSDIGNCPRDGSQYGWQTNTSLIEWRPCKSFKMNFSAPSLLEKKLGCTLGWEKVFNWQGDEGGVVKVDKGVGV